MLPTARYGTRCASSAASVLFDTFSPKGKTVEKKKLGACLLNNVPHDHFVSALVKGVSFPILKLLYLIANY